MEKKVALEVFSMGFLFAAVFLAGNWFLWECAAYISKGMALAVINAWLLVLLLIAAKVRKIIGHI